MSTDSAPREDDDTAATALASLARVDWVVTAAYDGGGKLHGLTAYDDPAQAEDDWGGPGTTLCGRHSAWLSIPGLFSRMGQERCAQCCKVAGYPRGVGSPKNDDDCRRLLGLPVKEKVDA